MGAQALWASALGLRSRLPIRRIWRSGLGSEKAPPPAPATLRAWWKDRRADTGAHLLGRRLHHRGSARHTRDPSSHGLDLCAIASCGRTVSRVNEESERWRDESEVLVGELMKVTSQRDRLKIRLADNEYLLADAMAYIDELEGLVKALDRELWRLRRAKSNRKTVAALAGAAGFVIGSLAGGIGEGVGTEFYRDLRNIEDRAAVVVMHCDGTYDLDAEAHRREPDPPATRDVEEDENPGDFHTNEKPFGTTALGTKSFGVVGAARAPERQVIGPMGGIPSQESVGAFDRIVESDPDEATERARYLDSGEDRYRVDAQDAGAASAREHAAGSLLSEGGEPILTEDGNRILLEGTPSAGASGRPTLVHDSDRGRPPGAESPGRWHLPSSQRRRRT